MKQGIMGKRRMPQSQSRATQRGRHVLQIPRVAQLHIRRRAHRHCHAPDIQR